MRRRVARVRVRRLDARDASVERVGRLAQRELELGARGGRLGGEPRVAEVRSPAHFVEHVCASFDERERAALDDAAVAHDALTDEEVTAVPSAPPKPSRACELRGPRVAPRVHPDAEGDANERDVASRAVRRVRL